MYREWLIVDRASLSRRDGLSKVSDGRDGLSSVNNGRENPLYPEWMIKEVESSLSGVNDQRGRILSILSEWSKRENPLYLEWIIGEGESSIQIEKSERGNFSILYPEWMIGEGESSIWSEWSQRENPLYLEWMIAEGESLYPQNLLQYCDRQRRNLGNASHYNEPASICLTLLEKWKQMPWSLETCKWIRTLFSTWRNTTKGWNEL